MATVKAIVRTTRKNVDVNIRFRLSDGRNVQLFHNSEIRINIDLWDTKNDCVKKRALCVNEKRNSINKAVDDRKNLLLSIYENNKNRDLTSEAFERLVDEALHPDKYKKGVESFFSLIELYIEKRKMQEGRRKTVCVMSQALRRYELFKQETENISFRLDIGTIDKDIMEDIESFLRNEFSLYEEYPIVYKKIKRELDIKRKKIRNKGSSTICFVLANLRAFFNWCIKEKRLDVNPFSEYEGVPLPKYGTPYYITIEERNHIADFDLAEYPRLARQRDIFIFQCLIGCRVSDLIRMTENNIINGAIEYIPYKTKGENPTVIRVPLNERAGKIVEKYRGTDKKGRLFSFEILWMYNKDIKEIFRLCGITRLVTTLNPVSGKEEKRPINEVASSHMARRTFVGNLYKKVKDPNLVGALSGHVEGSKAFARYREIDDEIKTELVKMIE